MAKFEIGTKKDFYPTIQFYIINIINIYWILFVFIVLKIKINIESQIYG